ncbi:MAG TPA: gephyrin-like molybdotransferase Glp [Alphaproteobacteria bacterium]|nr:gephyrin-like molybdotransferase Glp [Alphaproteobacteria bacterium]
MISVKEARDRMVRAFRPTPAEQVALADALGRVLAEDVVARRTQPPMAVSAMDGYAVRAADVAQVPAPLTVIGQAPAGGAYGGTVGPGQAVRIFTGGPVPDGADAIVIQEDVDADGAQITVRESSAKGRHIRPAGLDFREGAVGLRAGRRLGSREIGLAASMNVPWLQVRRRPRIALLATGDEIVMPGDPVGPNQIVSSNVPALAAFVAERGGQAVDLGIARDTVASLQEKAAGALGADLLVTAGGASVGDHDLVQEALTARGLDVDFWKIAMRPGKPLMFGKFGEVPLLGLPGNPVSSQVCALLFLGPVIDAMLGLKPAARTVTARLGADVAANDRREDYMRARLARDGDGELVATPFPKQDSSMVSLLVEAGCLVVRAPHAPAAKAGDPVEVIPLTPLW